MRLLRSSWKFLVSFGAVSALSVPAMAQLQPGYAILGKDPMNVSQDSYLHVDIGVAYINATSEWDLHWHIDPPVAGLSAEYAPDEALLYYGAQTATNVPVNIPALGLNAGQTIYLSPQSNPFPSPIAWVGVGAEENVAGDFVSNPNNALNPNANIRLYLKSVTGFNGGVAPGDFFAWQSGGLGGLDVRMRSNNGIGLDDFMSLGVGGHDHYNIAFSNPGFYEVTFEAIGNPANGGPTSSGDVTYYFGVLTTTASVAPEPSTLLLLVGCAVPVAFKQYRRKKRAVR